jgi:L-seryl-tRNA(Ser) seleniumtransferase
MSELRKIPSVEKIIQFQQIQDLIEVYGRGQTLLAIQQELDNLRQEIKKGKAAPSVQVLVNDLEQQIRQILQPSLVPVINASGVILHTNLGRAPLSNETIQAMGRIGTNYNTLEYDLESGKRSSRSVHTEDLLIRLTGTEAALIVNNNAAAVLLILSALANRRKVVISRSQLIEIGGGFRIPDVMKQSGAKLIEVGTTNRVHISDYEEALQEPVALVMRAHHSNFKILGFTEEPSLQDIVSISNTFGVPIFDDLGSGTFLDTSQFGLPYEPTILDSVNSGADLISFSGDKLLGGPQAGIIIGKKPLIERLKRHPLMRVIRPDKITLAGLNATLNHYLKQEAIEKIPIWRMIRQTPSQLEKRVKTWQKKLNMGEVVSTQSTIGGGSLPEESQPSCALAFKTGKADKIMKLLRNAETPVIARIENDRILFDSRTILPEQDSILIDVIQKSISQ